MSVLVVIAVAEEARYLPAEFAWTLTGIGKSAASNRYIRALMRLKEHLSGQSGIF